MSCAYPLTINFDYQLNHFCFPSDPVFDLSFRIGQMLTPHLFFDQDGTRIHLKKNIGAWYCINHYKTCSTRYRKEENYNSEKLTKKKTTLKVELHEDISNHSNQSMNKEDIEKFIEQQVKSILKLNVCIREKTFKVEDKRIVANFVLAFLPETSIQIFHSP